MLTLVWVIGELESINHNASLLEGAMDYTVQADLDQKLRTLEQIAITLPQIDSAARNLSHVLVTGATGLLGSYIVQDLLLHTDATIHCLVRAETAEQGLARIAKNFSLYHLTREERSWQRLKVVPGDLQAERLGLTLNSYHELADTIDTIFHCAANTSFVAAYNVSRKTNVCGTCELLQFAATQRLKEFHYVSSCSVRVPSYYRPTDTDIGLFNGYSQSKYVSERLVNFMFDQGLPGVQYNIGYLYATEDLNATSAFESLIRLFMELKLVPEMDAYFDYTPVWDVSKAMVNTALERDFRQRTQTLHHPVALHWREIVTALQLADSSVQAMPFATFFPIYQEFMKRYRGTRVYAMKKVLSRDFPSHLNAMFKGIVSDFSPANCPPTFNLSDLAFAFSRVKSTYEWM